MLVPTIIMGALAAILLVVGYYGGKGQHLTGLRSALNTTVQVLPLLLLSFIVAGMVQVLVPRETISKWTGAESGMRGILIGTVVGSLTPGGPYVFLPIAAGFLRAGAGVGTVVAFLAGKSLWAVTNLPMEVGIMGWKFTLIRLASTFLFAPLAGVIAQLVATRLG